MTITTVCQLDMQVVRQLIAEVLELPIDRVLENISPADTTQYDDFLTIKNSAQLEIGSQLTYNGVEQLETITSLREVTILVNAYGENSISILNNLVNGMQLNAIRSKMRQLRIGYLRASQIQNITSENSEKQEVAATVELIFSTNHITQANVNRGESVQITTKVN